jgi:hypothetical protein
LSIKPFDVPEGDLTDDFERGLVNDPPTPEASVMVGSPMLWNGLDLFVSAIDGIKAILPRCVAAYA